MTGTERRCATCRHWHRQGPQIANATRDPGMPADEGTCQTRGPTLLAVPVGDQPAGTRWPVPLFPRTHESRGCGEWRRREGAGPDGGEHGDVIVALRTVAA